MRLAGGRRSARNACKRLWSGDARLHVPAASGRSVRGTRLGFSDSQPVRTQQSARWRCCYAQNSRPLALSGQASAALGVFWCPLTPNYCVHYPNSNSRTANRKTEAR